MSIGTTLSGTGHAVFLVWMVVGWGLSSDPPPFEVMDVSVVSGADFAAMTQGVQPDLPPSEPAAIEQPVVDATPPAPVEETRGGRGSDTRGSASRRNTAPSA
jgi:hypothetical protein